MPINKQLSCLAHQLHLYWPEGEMDKIIEKKKWTPKKIVWTSLAAIVAVFVLYSIIFGDHSAKLNVQAERLAIETVSRDFLQDYTTITGTVQPIRTVYLDAIEGGQVEEIYIEEGTEVTAGDLILRLSNTNLHLNILNREASLAEQKNNLRNTRLLMEQNKLDLKQQILDWDYRIDQERKSYEDAQALYARELISQREFEDIRDTYQYYAQARDLVIESQKQDSLFRAIQITQLEESLSRMEENLSLVRKKLESLNVRASISGQLASINAEIGEAKAAGQRLGQINDLTSFKINADIDEHYISRVRKGLVGEFEFANATYQLQVTKIYPEVHNGRFYVDMEFVDEAPQRMSIGQTFRVRLELGQPKEAILIPRGGFYQTTGGQWIFVVNEDGTMAVKRDIRLGSMNPRFYEVLEGLEPGERVIVSSYENFGRAEKLLLK
jgi:HlyD family secretion protein